MSIQEKLTELDSCIKEYLWQLSEDRAGARTHNGELLAALREHVGCSFAFVLQKDRLGDFFSFSDYSSAMDELELDGVEFPLRFNDTEKLSKNLAKGSVGTEKLSFLGEDFANPQAYYGIEIDGEIWALVGVMDFDSQERQWSDHDKEAVSRVGKALTLCIEYAYLHDTMRHQSNRAEQQISTEQEQRRLLEEALVRAENANKAKQKFLVGMSHDIRTPMNAIVGFAALANTHIQEHERVRHYLGKITASSKHLLSLFNDVLDITSIEEGRAQLDELPNSLSAVVHDIRKMVSGLVDSKQVILAMEVVDVVHERIFCDRMRVNQVLLNLISNAIKYTGAGGRVSVTIKEKPGKQNGYASYEFTIKDSGVGMSADLVEHIFDPFEWEKTTARSLLQGTGLGMAITKNIVDMMQGDIVVNSKEGEGTEIVVTVELKLQSDYYVDDVLGVMPELNEKRILVVNSSPETCSNINAILNRFGALPERTLSASEAILLSKKAISEDAGYDAYFIDWHMPDMNGLEVVRQLRQFVTEAVPVIITVDGDYSDIESSSDDLGVLGFLSKPLFGSDIKEMVRGLMTGEAVGLATPAIVREDHFIGRRILLAEDNKMNQEIAVTILEDAGFFVDLAENGEVAVDKVINHPEGHYDLVLMDIKMPIMDGYEATRRIRSLPDKGKKNIPIVAMTADAFFEDRQQALQCGMNEHITKPVDVDRLFSILKSVIE